MTKHQQFTLLAFAVLFLTLFFAFEKKPRQLKEQERSRSLNAQVTDASILKREAFDVLEESERSSIRTLESRFEFSSDSLERVDALKELSSNWYRLGQLGIAGSYAEEVAKITGTAESWGIAGTTYGIGISNANSEKEKQFNQQKSIESLEMAISIDPENLDYQINRAVILAENPLPDNPMKGIQLLLDLNKNYPKNVTVMNNLAKFALQTNQLERAEQRLLTALAIEPNNIRTNCLLVQLYNKMGDTEKASSYNEKCKN